MSSVSVVDWPRLLELRDLQDPVGPDIVADLIATFLDESATRMAQLRAAARSGDLRRVRREAHAIKGGAGTLAADSLAHDAEQVELNAETTTGLDAMVDQLGVSLNAVCRCLNEAEPTAAHVPLTLTSPAGSHGGLGIPA